MAASSSRATLKLTQQQRQQAAKQQQAQRQLQMAAKQRDKRAHNRARIKQLKENAEAAEALVAAASAATASAAAAAAVPPSAAVIVPTAAISASPSTATVASVAVAAVAAGLKDPAHWEPVDPTHGNKHLLLLTKEKHSAELAEVEQHWQQTNGQGRVVAVHRIQNSALHHRFEGARQSTPGVTERLAYHGTRLNVPALIYDSPTGFDMSRGMAQPGSVTIPRGLQCEE
jgi:hypothetical protein